MKCNSTAITLAIMASLSGCGTIGSKTISDNNLARKAAFALNTTADKVKISNRHARGLTEVNFTATTGGREFQCYLSAGIYGTSDAVCAGTDGSMEGVRCDELSRASGRCK